MSYPPSRPPPMGMPPIPPGIMPQGYPYAPMGMMQMGMMPTMLHPTTMAMTHNQNTNTTSRPNKKLIPQEIPKDSKESEKPPVTTVFVGNISERAPDAMIKQMLLRCGNVLSWKRVQGASGKLQAFGFCEYEDPEATLRCIRLLNEWIIADRKLVVKVDAKTKTLLEDYKKKRKPKDGKEKKEEGEMDDSPIDALDEMAQREDRVAKAGLDAIMREFSVDLAKAPAEPADDHKKERKKEKKVDKDKDNFQDEGLEELEMEEDKKDLINREIRSFRDAHKDEDEKDDNERQQKQDEREYERYRARERREREREREKERLKEAQKEREQERIRIRTRERERERSRSKSRDRTREGGHKERSRPREREREREREIEKERDFDKHAGGDIEDEEEAYERRKLERKLRIKEVAYQERLKNWEARERKKSREYEKEKEREDERKNEESKEARRLKEFLEDYDDERDDSKYFKGSALQRRLKEREKEVEADARDRQREKEEIEDIRRKLLDEGHPDPDAEMARIERERDEHLMPRLNKSPSVSPERPEPVETKVEPKVEPQYPVQSNFKPVEAAPSVSSASSDDDDDDYQPLSSIPVSHSDESNSHSMPFIGPATKDDQQKAKLGFGAIKIGTSDSPVEPVAKRKKLTVENVFNQDEEESSEAKKRKLIPLDYSEDEKQGGITLPAKPTTAEEKRKCIKTLIERIPTAKEELFEYTLDWTMVDTTLMDRRIKPWVNKKIVEYIGEEEPTLTDFICQKVMAHSVPQTILNDVAMVLDEEAEVFVVKMWRLLIYETEAKKLGLVK